MATTASGTPSPPAPGGSVGPIGRAAWADLDGDAALLGRVDAPHPPVGLTARVDVSGLLGDSAALATLAIQLVQEARGLIPPGARVRVSGDRVRTSAQSERHLRIDGEQPSVWGGLSGFWETADGWVRTHGNYPHHAERLAELVGIATDADRATASAAFARWSSVALEDAAAEAGAIVGAVRSPRTWAEHPHAAVVANSPLLDVHAGGSAPARAWPSAPAAPLAGVRVLDLTRVLAGPVAARDLAFAGAEVLRVDSPRLPEIGWQHLDTGPGKRSTVLDLAAAADRRTFEGLLAEADVVITGYRPGSLDRYGLAAADLGERHPGLVVASVSAWGGTGPWAGRRGFDSIVQAVTGIATVQSADGRTPGALPAQALDHSAGHLLAAAVCRGLARQREEGGGWSVAVTLAGIATRLLALRGDLPTADAGAAGPAVRTDTVETGTTRAGTITCPAPALTYVGAPERYPALATPWGADAATWEPTG